MNKINKILASVCLNISVAVHARTLYSLAVACSLIFTTTTVFADGSQHTVYVTGERTRITQAEMDKTPQGGFTAEFDMSGDFGQSLMFDVDVIVEGKGHHEYKKRMGMPYPPRNGLPGGKRWRYQKGNRFIFEVAVHVTCSNLAVDYQKLNANVLLSKGESERHKKRQLKFLMDNTLTFHGECQQLKVEILPTQGHPGQPEKTVIESVRLDIHVLDGNH
ncbi:hypothetical protein [Algicola sagamiensis]|uniref:hypothetical protein n=1 Tax=Algicola sagamiensis TaxID=163869 RepID=UPI0003AA1C1D|nr:hypothetical protein [Algicola sagamiensis]